MKHKSWLVHWVLATLVVFVAGQVVAGEARFNNSVTEKGKCGHERVGKVQYVKNSDDSNSYEVTVKKTITHQGEVKTEENTLKVKAGGKKHLGCSMSEIMPLSTYSYAIVSEKET